MNYTKHEESIILELEKRAGDVLYFKDIARYFISSSCLQISTYSQIAYIQVGDNMQKALSEFFQAVVFIKKMEKNSSCFSIPYTPLEDNTVKIGNSDFEEYQQHTIADGDLLIQLFHYGAKKYVITPNASDQFQKVPKQSKVNFIIPSLILFFLFIFIGSIGYQSYQDHNKLKLQQEAIRADVKKQSQKIGLLSDNLQKQLNEQKNTRLTIFKEFSSFTKLLKKQNVSLESIKYWNYQQSKQLKNLKSLINQDSLFDK